MPLDGNLKKILIVDFGSQFTQLIARKIRELGVYCEIISHNKLKKIKNFETNIKGLVFSGGPLNVYENKKVKFNNKLLRIHIKGECHQAPKEDELEQLTRSVENPLIAQVANQLQKRIS